MTKNLQNIEKSVTTNLVTISDRIEVDIVIVVAKILMQILVGTVRTCIGTYGVPTFHTSTVCFSIILLKIKKNKALDQMLTDEQKI